MPALQIIPDEPIDLYHGRDSRTLGSSRIKDFLEHGPAWWDLRYNRSEIPPRERTKAMRDGSLLDAWMTERSLWNQRHVIAPPDIDFRTKDGKAFREAHAGKEIVTAEEMDILMDCERAIGEHAAAANHLNDPACKSQVTLRYEMGNGLVLQARPDFLVMDDGEIWIYDDLKKVDDLDAFPRKAIDFGYHRQLAIAQWLAARAGKRLEAYLLAVEWQRGARARLFRMPEIALQAGWDEVRETIDEIAMRFEDNDWSDDCPGEVDDLEIPDWMLRKLGGAA